MNAPTADRQGAASIAGGFREHRVSALVAVNMHTFWIIAIIVAAFSVWDYFVDPIHWRAAFKIRLVGTIVVIATGVLQNLPGQQRRMPLLARIRFVVAIVTTVMASALLDGGYGYGVAGLVVIFLTGPYIALDSRDLLRTNLLALAALIPVVVGMSLPYFDLVGTFVFVALAVTVSTLLTGVLETSHRRAYALEQELHRDARTDALTGLDNRRSMQERGRTAVKLARRTGAPVSLMLCDFDRFKDINDKYGHEAGDSVLIKTAAILRDQLRDSDVIGRWGGEEFIAVLPATHEAGAIGVAEKLRAAIAATKFDNLAELQTISIGVATSQTIVDPALEWDLLLKEADQRLYRAKREGRNRVVAG